MVGWVYQQVLGLNVPVAYAEGVDVCECSVSLVCVQFDQQNGHRLLHFVVVLQDAVDCLWDVVHHHVQVYFIGLQV